MFQPSSFTADEIQVVGDAMDVAEDSVRNYYHLNDSRWRSYFYELRTLADLAPTEISPHALAQVLRLRQPPTKGRLRSRDFYRICLQDHNLLGLVGRDRQKDLFRPLLVYVLAHELVHVVRFYKFQHLFEGFERHRDTEEKRVYALTEEILSPLRLSQMDKVLSLYREQECGQMAQA